MIAVTRIRGAPASVLAATAAASIAAVGLASVQGWPGWAMALAALVVWLPLGVWETVWTSRHYGWFALLAVLVVTQGGHVLEHVAQMVQLHLLGRTGPHARGVFGALDVEWVHVTWNTWVFVAVALLVWRFPRNGWLWGAAIVAGWHEAEHLWIMSTYLRTGVAGSPGLLSSGGAIGGGVAVVRPDLHFLYNVVETTPLVAAFFHQLRRTHDAWLARALPRLEPDDLVRATGRVNVRRLRAGEVAIGQGDFARSFYVVSRGALEVVRDGQRVAVLGPGQFFGELGLLGNAPHGATVRAVTPAEILALDRGAFAELLGDGGPAGAEIERVARERTVGAFPA